MSQANQKVARLRREETILLVVDVQERLLPVIHEAERVVKNCEILARAAIQLKIPIVAAEQYPKFLGGTEPSLVAALGDTPIFAKMLFSACTGDMMKVIEATHRRSVLVCGIEAHVCVMQTALDLLEAGFTVFVAGDATSSRTAENHRVGWERMLRAGAVPTSAESAVFELLREAGTPDFKALLPVLK